MGRTPNPGVCYDLAYMFQNWQKQTVLRGLPFVFTETNWSAVHDLAHCEDQDRPTCSGAYLVDLYTYLYDHCGFGSGPCHSGGIQAGNATLRVAWFRAVDQPEDPTTGTFLGRYDTNGNGKVVTIPQRLRDSRTGRIVDSCRYNRVYGAHPINNDYFWLRNSACY